MNIVDIKDYLDLHGTENMSREDFQAMQFVFDRLTAPHQKLPGAERLRIIARTILALYRHGRTNPRKLQKMLGA